MATTCATNLVFIICPIIRIVQSNHMSIPWIDIKDRYLFMCIPKSATSKTSNLLISIDCIKIMQGINKQWSMLYRMNKHLKLKYCPRREKCFKEKVIYLYVDYIIKQ